MQYIGEIQVRSETQGIEHYDNMKDAYAYFKSSNAWKISFQYGEKLEESVRVLFSTKQEIEESLASEEEYMKEYNKRYTTECLKQIAELKNVKNSEKLAIFTFFESFETNYMPIKIITLKEFEAYYNL